MLINKTISRKHLVSNFTGVGADIVGSLGRGIMKNRLARNVGVGALGGAGWGLGQEGFSYAAMTPEERQKYTRRDFFSNVGTNVAGGVGSGLLVHAVTKG